jgi:hypothetical protein
LGFLVQKVERIRTAEDGHGYTENLSGPIDDASDEGVGIPRSLETWRFRLEHKPQPGASEELDVHASENA